MREKDGSLDRTLLVFTKPSASTWQGKLLHEYARELRGIVARYPGPDGQVPRVAGQGPLSADIVDSLSRDGPIATSLALAA